MRIAIVPVKDMSRAKERLSPVLSQSDRTKLANIMLEDVLTAVKGSKLLTKLFVVTSDGLAIDLASSLDIEFIREAKQESESSSIDYSSNVCKDLGAGSVLVIPGDVPLIRPEDVDYILEREKPRPSAILVPARDGLGTNAILRRPPDAFPSRFGYDSFNKHIEEAKKRGIEFDIYHLPRIALDIDEPKDLTLFLSQKSDTKTYIELGKIGNVEQSGKIVN
jgi:2-phospho-L-lactate/phosphoenolpyruvate guanylyltransferase